MDKKIKNKNLVYLLTALILFSTTAQINAEVIDGRFYPFHTKPAVSQPITKLKGHYKNKINFVFSDIDGTLIPFNRTGAKSEVPESVKIGAEILKAANIPLVLVTGRSSVEAREIANRIGISHSYLIAQQGAQIVTPDNKIIYDDNINNSDSKNIIKEIEAIKKADKLNVNTFVFLDGELYTDDSFEIPHIFQKQHILKSYNDLTKIKKDFSLNKIGIYSNDIKALEQIQKQLKSKYPNYNIDISADCFCDISSGTATKGNAIKKLSSILGINLKNAATFGDAENDISMLKLINKNGGLAVAVGNAMPSVKANANYVTLSSSDGGFLKAVNIILENNKKIK